MKNSLKILFVLLIFSLFLLGCTNLEEEQIVDDEKIIGDAIYDLDANGDEDKFLISQEEAVQIIIGDENWEEFKANFEDFEPVLIHQEKLEINNFSDLEKFWENDDRLSNLLDFMEERDFSGNNYFLEFDNANDEDVGLLTIIDLDKKETLFIAAFIKMEFG